MTTTDAVAPIKTEGLTKHYGDVKALVDLDLSLSGTAQSATLAGRWLPRHAA